MRPEGPWSKPLIVYKCPETDKKIFQYGAKAHPELATRDGQLIATYCRNIGSLADHMARPEDLLPASDRSATALAGKAIIAAAAILLISPCVILLRKCNEE